MFWLLAREAGMQVKIETPVIEYSTEGFHSRVSKEYPAIQAEIDVFYQDITAPEEQFLPVTVFSQHLSPLQATVRYLKDKGLTYVQIARLLNRDQRTIWATYAATEKELKQIETDVFIPASVLANRNLSTLESIVSYLLEQGLAIKAIAALLGKDYKTIWTIKSRLQKKRGGANE
ncbi:hypothetical protein ACFL1B_02340 [Nanoarchaeota archaeon]